MVEIMSTAKLDEFVSIIDSIQGLYLDMRRGFGALVHDIQNKQAEMARDFPGQSIDNFDKLDFTYHLGTEGDATYSDVHRCLQGEFKRRNSPSGENPARAGNMCLVQIFQFWNDHYRPEIEISLGWKKGMLKVDVMGDMRLLRNLIIHHGAIADERVRKLRILKWFDDGDRVEITREQFLQLVTLIKEAMQDVRKLMIAPSAT